MSEDNGPQRLTLEDPVDPAMLEHLESIQTAWMDLAERNTHLDQEKIRILAALKKIDDERRRAFEKIQIERGIPVTSSIEIDSKTGLVQVLEGSE